MDANFEAGQRIKEAEQNKAEQERQELLNVLRSITLELRQITYAIGRLPR